MRTVMPAKMSASSTLAEANSREVSSRCAVSRLICACAALTLRYCVSIRRATTAMKASWSRNRSMDRKLSGVSCERMRRPRWRTAPRFRASAATAAAPECARLRCRCGRCLCRPGELLHDAVVVHRIGVARQHGEDFGEAGLLAVQFADQAVGDLLVAHQAGGILLNRLDIADAHGGRGEQQQNHQGEPQSQHPEDVPVGDLAWKHGVFSMARRARSDTPGSG
jgi:hypothetical protein